ncbi:helix-turn-helix transcriptional regulator, partial [Nocardiopsis tropica]
PAGQVPTPADTPMRGGAQVSAEEGARNRALVWDTRDQIIEATGKAPSINALAEATGLSRRAVGRHLKADD